MAELYDLYRVDHVVGLYRTYFFPSDGSPAAFVPADEPAQIANGERVLGLLSEGARVIAEDLGTVPDFVRASLERLGIPGYRVQRWEKNWEAGGRPSAIRPVAGGLGRDDRHARHRVAGGLVRRALAGGAGALLALAALAGLRERAPDRFDDGVRDALLRRSTAPARTSCSCPFQDALGDAGAGERPGHGHRRELDLPDADGPRGAAGDRGLARRLRALAARPGRLAGR